jgi:hypothetical protein
MSGQLFRYRANGLTLESTIELPELAPADDVPDVHIRYGEVPERLAEPIMRGARYETASGEYLLTLPGVGRYWVKDGRQVVIAPDPGATDEDVRVFILSSVMGALAHQRGFLPLHASALEVNGGCVLFAGDSGSGKSTIAAAFHHRGYRLAADDICAISLGDEGYPVVHPGYRHLKLWADAVEQFGDSLGERRKMRFGLQKYNVLLREAARTTPLRVTRIFIFARTLSDRVALRTLHGRAKVSAIRQQTFRLRLLKGLGVSHHHFPLLHALGQAPVVAVHRPLQLSAIDELVTRLEENMHGIGPVDGHD